MAATYQKLIPGRQRHIINIFMFLLLASCTSGKKMYMSDCDVQQTFKRVTFSHLLDSLAYYDQQYVEVAGRYQEGKSRSALYNDSTYVNLDSKALWVNFSQDCPLYLSGTQTGLFEDSNGAFNGINNRKIRLRGKIDIHNRGNLKRYKGCIDRVSMIEL